MYKHGFSMLNSLEKLSEINIGLKTPNRRKFLEKISIKSVMTYLIKISIPGACPSQ